MRIAAAAEWLARKGHNKLVLASHSLGSWMSQHYLESAKPTAFAAWIWTRRSPRSAEEYLVPIASGVIAGISILGVFDAFVNNVLLAGP